MRRLLTTAAATGVVAAAATLHALAPAWRTGSAEVIVSCPLTVGGHFDAKTKALEGRLDVDPANPSRLTGTLAVDLSTLETGISLRDSHLRERYLEVGKGEGYRRAVLSDVVLVSRQAASFSGRTNFTATLLVHGATKPVAGEATVTRSGRTVKVDATFPISLNGFAIPEPRYLGVGVRDQVRVRATFVATEE